uniref:Transmembrane protein n=1 Tax=Anopheles farauti TaxID=69004 RepID=A0A182QN95_9DIPT
MRVILVRKVVMMVVIGRDTALLLLLLLHIQHRDIVHTLRSDELRTLLLLLLLLLVLTLNVIGLVATAQVHLVVVGKPAERNVILFAQQQQPILGRQAQILVGFETCPRAGLLPQLLRCQRWFTVSAVRGLVGTGARRDKHLLVIGGSRPLPFRSSVTPTSTVADGEQAWLPPPFDCPTSTLLRFRLRFSRFSAFSCFFVCSLSITRSWMRSFCFTRSFVISSIFFSTLFGGSTVCAMVASTTEPAARGSCVTSPTGTVAVLFVVPTPCDRISKLSSSMSGSPASFRPWAAANAENVIFVDGSSFIGVFASSAIRTLVDVIDAATGRNLLVDRFHQLRLRCVMAMVMLRQIPDDAILRRTGVSGDSSRHHRFPIAAATALRSTKFSDTASSAAQSDSSVSVRLFCVVTSVSSCESESAGSAGTASCCVTGASGASGVRSASVSTSAAVGVRGFVCCRFNCFGRCSAASSTNGRFFNVSILFSLRASNLKPGLRRETKSDNEERCSAVSAVTSTVSSATSSIRVPSSWVGVVAYSSAPPSPMPGPPAPSSTTYLGRDLRVRRQPLHQLQIFRITDIATVDDHQTVDLHQLASRVSHLQPRVVLMDSTSDDRLLPPAPNNAPLLLPSPFPMAGRLPSYKFSFSVSFAGCIDCGGSPSRLTMAGGWPAVLLLLASVVGLICAAGLSSFWHSVMFEWNDLNFESSAEAEPDFSMPSPVVPSPSRYFFFSSRLFFDAMPSVLAVLLST